MYVSGARRRMADDQVGEAIPMDEPNRAEPDLLRKMARYAPIGLFAIGIFLAFRPKRRVRTSDVQARKADFRQ